MPAPARSFPEIGFQCNPFRALTREEWVRAAILPQAVARAADSGAHLQLLGGAGSEKTSCLLALDDRFTRAGMQSAYEYLPPKGRSYRTETDGLDVFLLDEAQRLAKGRLFFGSERARWRRAAGGGVRLILGTHEDIAPKFRRWGAGLLTVTLSAPSPDALAEILERRLNLFSLKVERAKFSPESVEWLRKTFGNTLRTMEYFLYDYFQEEMPVGIIRTAPLEKAFGFFKPPLVEAE